MRTKNAKATQPAPPPAAPVVTAVQPVKSGPTYHAEIEDLIRTRAYEKWEAAGRPPGRDVEFWLEAQSDVLLGRNGRPALDA